MAKYLNDLDLTSPYGVAARQPFEFESWVPPEQQPDQPWQMPSWQDFALDPDTIMMLLNPMQHAARWIAENPYEFAYDMTADPKSGPYLSPEERAALPLRDPRRDAITSLAIGAADLGAGAAVKYGPKVGRAALGHTPEFINSLNRKYGLPELPFEMDITGYHYGRTKGLSELDSAYHGEGAMGKERAYSQYMDEDLKPTYFYLDEDGTGVIPEVEVISGAKAVYKADLPDDLMYDKVGDPNGLWKAAMDETAEMSGTGNAMPSLATPIFLRNLKEAGFKGYFAPNPQGGQSVGAVFGKTSVDEMPEGFGMSAGGVTEEEIADMSRRIVGFNSKSTDMPLYDDFFRSDWHTDYFRTEKGFDVAVENMSPDEYIRRAARGFKQDPDKLIGQRSPDVVSRYAEEMKRGDKFPSLMLDYFDGFSQEGLHRAMAAKEAGIDSVPVYIRRDIRKKPPVKTSDQVDEFDRQIIEKELSDEIAGKSVLDEILDDFDVPPAPEVLALPNPARELQANQVERQARWDALGKAAKNAGSKRQKSTGRYVGAGPDITSPQKMSGVVTQYMNRVKKALDAGIPRGYFYASGRQALADVTPDVEHHKLMSELMQPTSTQVGPYENLNYAIRAHDQFRMGENVYSGIYPNDLRGSIQAALHDTKPFMGYKVDRYGNLLGPQDPSMHPMSVMPPNDMWEGLGTGLGKAKPPSGATQVAFSDEVRERAMTRLNDELVAAGEKPLSREEVQELHWLVIRAENKGLPLEVGAKDTIQGSIPHLTAQHSWEAAPTPAAGIDINMPMNEYSEEVISLILDDVGKDRFVYAMGGDLQLPAVRGTGVYKGQTNEGVQSRSLVAKTEHGGLEPASAKRLDATEALRGFALGQEGRATHVPLQAKSLKGAKMFEIDAAGTPTADQMEQIDYILNQVSGPSGKNSFTMQTDDIATVFTEDGYRALDVSGFDESGFGKRVSGKKDELLDVTGGEMKPADFDTTYGEYNWGAGGVTEDLMNVINDPAYPNVRRLADSPQTRELMGDMARLYKDLETSGQLSPNQKLVDVLDAWSTGGIQAVQRLVDKGLAPAVALGVFAGLPDEQQPETAL